MLKWHPTKNRAGFHQPMSHSIFDMEILLPPIVLLPDNAEEAVDYAGEQTLDLTLHQNFFIYLPLRK
tara:strand:+ start:1149 stop:1349 length:201 start_codon:yes stop_codon:yes gene_type:complete